MKKVAKQSSTNLSRFTDKIRFIYKYIVGQFFTCQAKKIDTE